MLVELPSIPPAPSGEEDAVPDGLAARVASGPGFWTDWLAEPDRQGLLEDLLAGGVIARALREAPTGHRYDRVLTAKMTAICVLVACLFPGDGYDAVLAKAFRLPGLRFSPGTGVPAGSALSQARRLLGEQAMRRIFELDAERSDADLGITSLWKGLEVTAIDGTTMELARNDALACEFGTPADGARPLLRIVAHVRTASRRWISAEIGGYHDGENDLADKLEWSFRPGMLNLADRGFFSMDRFLRFSATGSDLAWRVKNGAKCVPFKTVRELPDGSGLVMLHESDGMRTRRRRDTGNPHAERLPGTTARLVTFTILTATRSGRAKTTQMRVLTTLLDHEAFPAREIAALYAERWQVETAFLHLKKTVRGPRRALRGQSPDLARQEAWALHQALAREGFWFLGTFHHPGIPIPWCHTWRHRAGATVEVLPVPLHKPPFAADGADVGGVRQTFTEGSIDGQPVPCLSAELQPAAQRLSAAGGRQPRRRVAARIPRPPGWDDDCVTGNGSRVSRPQQLRTAVGAVVGRAMAGLRPESILIVPVLDAESAVGAWLGTTKVDFDGVPLHVTVMYPFLPARSVRQPQEERIAELAASIAPFDYALTHHDTFPGVHYLAPEPAAPFVAITEAIQCRWPSCKPYGGVYDSVIPHMTVAFGDPPADPAELIRALPIVTRASELWLLSQTPRGWRTRRRFPLG